MCCKRMYMLPLQQQLRQLQHELERQSEELTRGQTQLTTIASRTCPIGACYATV